MYTLDWEGLLTRSAGITWFHQEQIIIHAHNHTGLKTGGIHFTRNMEKQLALTAFGNKDEQGNDWTVQLQQASLTFPGVTSGKH